MIAQLLRYLVTYSSDAFLLQVLPYVGSFWLSWALLGALGCSWGALGTLLGALRALWGTFFSLWGVPWSFFLDFWWLGEGFWMDFRRFRDVFL